jgi:predicted DNA-binding transcriptional regulator YafY
MPAKKRRAPRPKPRFTPSQRRDELRVLLRTGWQPLTAIMERLEVSRATAFRRIRELGDTDPVEVKEEAPFTYWRLSPTLRDHAFSLNITTSEMVSLAFVKNALGFLAGTGLKEDLDALLGRFAHALRSSDYGHWKNLDRKLYDVNEGAYDYGGDGDGDGETSKLEVVNDVVTALLREERITCALKDGRRVVIEPYTLVLYKKGLYLLGFSHEHKEVRRYGLDKICDTERRAGDRFTYPADFEPKAHMAGPFGIIRGPRESVVVRFDASMAQYVRRRIWHATQAIRDVAGGVEMTLEPEGTTEMVSWVLSFGGKAEVIAPERLREEVAREAREAVARYERATARSETG